MTHLEFSLHSRALQNIGVAPRGHYGMSIAEDAGIKTVQTFFLTVVMPYQDGPGIYRKQYHSVLDMEKYVNN